jgi:hypothetical protein
MPTWAIVLLILGGIVAALCIGGVALLGIGAKAVTDSNTAADKDVTLSSCTDGGELVGPQATVTITNHGKSSASYFVTVEFVSSDGGTQYGTGTAIVNGLAPGQNATADATSFAAGKASGSFKCRVTKVTKT